MSRTRTTPALSIVVPVFRNSALAQQTIPSLCRTIGAGLSSFEVLCVNDGGGDEASARLGELARTLPHVRIVECRHQGQHGAILEGLAMSLAPFIATTDVDLEASPEWMIEAVERGRSGYHLVNGVRRGWRRWGLGTLAVRLPLFLIGPDWARLSDLSSPYKLVSRPLAQKLLTLRGQDHFLALHAARWGAPSFELPLRQDARFKTRSTYRLTDRARLYMLLLRDVRQMALQGRIAALRRTTI